jgi:pyruvate/2-oxoglutarate dehydrogenase complex dihydrolipoamide dehydrogenase (E3) component
VTHFDVVVLGGGSAAETCATQVASGGRSVVIVEAWRVGGECPFVACMPSKAVLRSAAVRHLATNAHELGAVSSFLHLDEAAEAYEAALSRRDEVAEHLDDSSHVQELAEAGVALVRAKGRVVEPGVVEAGEERLEYTDLVVATGSSPTTPPIDGIDALDVWTSDDVWTTHELPGSLIVLGGGPVGVEVAQAFARFGCAVILMEAEDRILPREDTTIAEVLAEALTDDGVMLRTGFKAGLDDLRGADRVVIATGRTPNVEGIGLEQLGIEPDRSGLAIDDRCRVSGLENVWAIGDVTGTQPFTHTANYQGRVAAANLLGRDVVADYRAVPRTVFTDPEVAAAGLTPAQAADQGIAVRVASMDLAQTARASSDGTGGGRLQIVADGARGVAVGAAVVGPHAAELITQAGLAIRAEVPLAVWADLVQPFPTYSEAWFPALGELIA